MGPSLNALCFKVRLHIYRTFFKVYPLMIPFFMGANPATIPVSVIVGCLVGFGLCYTIDKGNRKIEDKRNKRRFALSISGLFIVGSAFMFSYGCSYIEEVWGDQNNKDGVNLLEVLSLVVWLVVAVLLHVSVWKVSRDMRQSGTHGEYVAKRPRTFFGSSVFVSGRNLLSRRFLGPASTKSFKPSSNRSGNHPSGRSIGQILDDSENLKHHSVPKMSTIEESMDASESQTAERSSLAYNLDAEAETKQTDDAGTGPEAGGTTPMDTLKEESTPVEQSTPKSIHDIYENPQSTGTVHFNEHATTAESGDFGQDEEEPEDDDIENNCHLVNVVCCDLNCGAGGKQKPFSDKCHNCCRWTLWTLLMAASLFFVVLLIGAQYQEKEVKSLLPRVHHILYSEMNTGPVCTYDDNYDAVTIRERVEASQRTFPSKEEAVLAGYKVLHCGACSACSNYPDMRQQWTTREILGQVALTCAKKTLLGGGFDALRECTMEKTGFEYDCATCWTKDYECVKKNCIFVSIRAFMINTVTNLQVGDGDITPSTCEEAMCEATEITGYIGFVPCSGASRRRMNIKSSIKRPIEQQCTIVDVPSWARFFGPSTGNGEYPEDWNATTVDWNVTAPE